jgi:phosphoglycolate phosphatase
MYKAIIFDLDGTLLNTSKDIHKVLSDTLAHFSLPQISLEKTIEYVGNGAKKLVERAMPKDKLDMLQPVYEYYSQHFAACDNSLTCLYEGEEVVLKELKKRGVKLALITNKPQAATDGVYAKHLSKFNFDIVIGQDDMPLKPNPQSTIWTIQQLGVDNKDCLFVGDGETDVQTAANAGIDCVSVLWGYRTRQQLKQAGAELFSKDYKQLSNIIFGNTTK